MEIGDYKIEKIRDHGMSVIQKGVTKYTAFCDLKLKSRILRDMDMLRKCMHFICDEIMVGVNS